MYEDGNEYVNAATKDYNDTVDDDDEDGGDCRMKNMLLHRNNNEHQVAEDRKKWGLSQVKA